eukprot:g39846.t1
MDHIASTDKAKGGGVCFLNNTSRCSDVVTLARHRSPDLEYLTVKCYPYYLPREFTSAILTAVYIQCHADVKNALDMIYTTTNTLETKFSDALFIAAGDFNQADLQMVLPKKSDHSAVFLLPAYKQKLKLENPSQKEVQCWSKAVEDRLGDCLESVDWSVFKCSAANLDEYATTIMDFPRHTCSSVTAPNVRPVFLGVNPRKAMGPGGVPGQTSRSCADQLVEVFTNIFDLSLLQAEVPTCFKKATVIP